VAATATGEADGPYYNQEWEDMPETTLIISGGINALRLPAFFESLGHSNVTLAADSGASGHEDGPKQGAASYRQGEEAWKLWKAGTYGNVSLSDGVIEFAKTHQDIKFAFLTLQKDADQIYPGWREKLGYTHKSSAQAASSDSKEKAPPPALAVEPLPDQSSRYTDLSLDQKSLSINGKHVLVTYTRICTCLPRLAMIGMFFQADPTGSFWVEGALYTASLLRAEGFWDPLGFTTGGSAASFARHRQTAIRHGRIATLAATGPRAPGKYNSTWVRWARYIFSLLRAEQSDLEIQALEGFWDPAGFTADDSTASSARHCQTAIKHGRVATLAATCYSAPEIIGKLLQDDPWTASSSGLSSGGGGGSGDDDGRWPRWGRRSPSTPKTDDGD
jgi:hypothetical protein